jgi:hypothetical protein
MAAATVTGKIRIIAAYAQSTAPSCATCGRELTAVRYPPKGNMGRIWESRTGPSREQMPPLREMWTCELDLITRSAKQATWRRTHTLQARRRSRAGL